MTGVHDLPSETIAHIFRALCLGNPLPAPLASAALVCRFWHEVALPLAFSTLKVGRREKFGDAFGDVGPFLDQNPHIARCVQQLCLHHPSKESKHVTIYFSTVFHIVSRLPAIRSLSLVKLKLMAPGMDEDIFHTTRIPLENVIFDQCDFRGLTASQFLFLLMPFDIGTLDLIGVTPPRQGGWRTGCRRSR